MQDIGTLADLLDAAADKWPTAPMLNFFGDDSAALTFEDVRRQSCGIAAALAGCGVVTGTKVAVMLRNVPLFPMTWLAIARLGAVMVPLNPSYTGDEVNFAIEDADVTHVVTHEDLLDKFPNPAGRFEGRTLAWRGGSSGVLYAAWGPIDLDDSTHAADPWPQLDSSDLVGIHYTSGTTGFPKGCLLDHRAWLTMSSVTLGLLPRTPRRILSDAPFFYIDALSECCMAMWSGAEQYVARKVSPSQFTRWLVDFDIDYAEVWEALGSRSPDPDSEKLLRLRTTPIMLSSFGLTGEQRPALASRLNATIQEMYGMTEIGLATAMPFNDPAVNKSGSCGLVVPHRETRVVNPDTLIDVPPGEIGELWVRGEGVMHGYHNRPEVNEHCFPGDGWFRTGDLFTRDARGYHTIVGRIKDMIRRSHENIAASEVEAAFLSASGVAQVAVIGVPDRFRGEEVKAFIILEPEVDPAVTTPQSLLGHAAKILAPFKLPRYIEFLHELPLTPSGKVSKAALKNSEKHDQPRGFDAIDDVWRT